MKQFVCFLIVFTLFFAGEIQAKETIIDSLQKVLALSQEDTSKVNTLIQLSMEIRTEKPEEAVRYGKAAVELARKLNY
ncbi:MAG TPA: hypothetical protein PKK99_11690, partial [Bacteroidia bacterium]|nr:hypothetical protein [Bacteroidia bacterium]